MNVLIGHDGVDHHQDPVDGLSDTHKPLFIVAFAVVFMGQEDYPDDAPYPSRLLLGYAGTRPLHVVAADHATGGEQIIITVYEPDPAQWEPTFTLRKKS